MEKFSFSFSYSIISGAVSLEYPLSHQPIYGNWTIRVVAQGQEETKQFIVEEFCEFANSIIFSQ